MKTIDYILIAEGVLLAILAGIIIARPAPACYESLDVTKGQNFNQPILTEHNCKAGELPSNWQNFEAK